MMFLLYFLINLLNFSFYFILNIFNKFYLNFNKFNLIFKKPFNQLTFLEKYFLIFFTNSNWFFKSICSFSDYSKDVLDYRKKNHPLIHFLVSFNNNKIIIKKVLFFKKKFYHFIKNILFFNIGFKDYLIFQNLLFKKYFNIINVDFVKFNFFFFYINFSKTNYYYRHMYNVHYTNKLKLNLNRKLFNQYNLKFYNVWYFYMFDVNNKLVYKKHYLNLLLKKLKNEKKKYIKKIYIVYKNRYKFKGLIKLLSLYTFKTQFFKKINFKKSFFKNLTLLFPVRFSESSLNKYINYKSLINYNFFYIRKNKIFNKSRYSRNRQLYRTGVYWCLWLNIIIVYGLYFFFYRFTFNFGYLWIGLFLIFFSTIFSRVVKYKFYNIYYLFNEFYKFFYWVGYLILNIIINLSNYSNLYKKTNFINLLFFNKSNFYNFYNFISDIINYWNKKKDYGFVFIWENYSKIDNSFLKYKTIIHWFKQVYKVITY